MTEQTTEERIARSIAETLFGYFDPAEDGSTSPSQQARLAARAVATGRNALSHEDLCRLSRVFVRHANLFAAQDQRINEWLMAEIAEARNAARQPR